MSVPEEGVDETGSCATLSPSTTHHLDSSEPASHRLEIVATASLLLLALGLGLALRIPDLGHRPMHTDEAILGFKFGELLETGTWIYDPADYHGPALPYLTLPFAWGAGQSEISGVSEELLRSVPLAFCVATMLATLLLARGLGASSCGWAMLFVAVSPMFVYFSRYYIMEMLLVFFTLAAIASGWRYYCSRRPFWAVTLGASLAMMHAAKETCVIHYFGMAAGVAGCWICGFLRPAAGPDFKNALPFRWGDLKLALAAFGIVWFLMFSSFFSNFPQGLIESITTYESYLNRAEGSGHEKPWFYYLKLLLGQRNDYYFSTEAGVYLLAVVGVVSAFVRRPSGNECTQLPRFLAIYAVAVGATYSLIAYKTPWTIMGFHHAVILLAGFGATSLFVLFNHAMARVAVTGLIGAICLHLGYQAKLATGKRFEADTRNSYVYSHTSTAFLKLLHRIEKLSEVKGEDGSLRIDVIHSESAWPLPWYLRDRRHDLQFPRQYSENMLTETDVIVTEPAMAEELRLRLGSEFTEDGFQSLRPNHFLTVFIRTSLWQAFIEKSQLQPSAPAQ